MVIMKRYSEKIMHVVFLLAACASILAVILICAFLFVNGIPTIGKIGLGNFALGKIWMPKSGIFPNQIKASCFSVKFFSFALH